MNCIIAYKCKIILVFAVMQFLFTNISLSYNIKDSTYVVPELTVTGDKYLRLPAMNYIGNTVIEKSVIEAVMPTTIDELFRFSPSTVIKDYGGMGGMKTVSIRGTLGAQTLITLNGTKINFSQNGMIDLSTLPVTALSEIQILRGGLSANYGSNALGGVVNIITDKKLSKLNIAAKYGSFGEKVINLSGGIVEHEYNFGAFAEYKSSDGNYPVEVNQYGNHYTYSRMNADFSLFSFGANAGFNATLNDKLNFDFIGSFADRGVPGAILQGNLESLTARSRDLFSIMSFNYFKEISPFSSFKTTVSYRYGENHYVDEIYVPVNYAGDSHFYSNDFNITNQFDYLYEMFKIRLTNEIFYSKLNGDMLDKSINGEVYRYGTSCSISADARELISNIDIFLATRIDFFNEHESSISPFFGINYAPLKGTLEFPLSVSYNFRLPSFNELYYLNYGNLDLKPEKSLSYNLGVIFTALSNVNTKMNLFLINTQDLILSVPKSPVLWSAQNIGNARSLGYELEIDWRILNDLIFMSFAYTRMDVRDKEISSPNYDKLLPYFPQESISGFINIKYYDFYLFIKSSYHSFTYSLRNNDHNSLIEAYTTLDVALSKRLRFDNVSINPRFDVINIVDEKFSVIKNYPMPGRIFRFSVNVMFGGDTK